MPWRQSQTFWSSRRGSFSKLNQQQLEAGPAGSAAVAAFMAAMDRHALTTTQELIETQAPQIRRDAASLEVKDTVIQSLMRQLEQAQADKEPTAP